MIDAPLRVLLHGIDAGRLRLDERRRMVFAYSPGWLNRPEAIPLSLTLPLRERPFEDDLPRAYFAGLLPQGQIRQAAAARLGVSEQNDYALLAAMAGDCAGAVSLVSDAQPPASGSEYRPLTEPELRELAAILPQRPLLAGVDGVRLTLGGRHRKLPVHMHRDQVLVPLGASPSSHILKLPLGAGCDSVRNEAFCMRLAWRAGLPTSRAEVRDGLETLYLVQRCDREAGDDAVRCVHLEDFGQALGCGADREFEHEGGPGLQQCFELLRHNSVRPAADMYHLLRWVVFNYLIGNTTAGVRNLAMLLDEDGPRLAPFHSLKCTVLEPGSPQGLALSVGGSGRHKWVLAEDWESFADTVGIRHRLVRRTVDDMVAMLPDLARRTAETFRVDYGESPVVGRIVQIVDERARRSRLLMKKGGHIGFIRPEASLVGHPASGSSS